MLRDVSNPPVAPKRSIPAAERPTCACCCEYEMTVQRLREAFDLLWQSTAMNDPRRTK